MNFPKPLLPSQDRYEYEKWLTTKHSWQPEPRMSRFATIFCWVLVLTGFALIGWAFAFYA